MQLCYQITTDFLSVSTGTVKMCILQTKAFGNKIAVSIYGEICETN